MASLTPRIDNLEARTNLFINSNFDYWQRSTSANAGGGFSYFAPDRWGGWGSGSGTRHLVSRDTSVPNSASKYSMKITGTATSTSVRMMQRIEAVNLRPYLNGKITVSFWVFNNIGSTITPTIVLQIPTAEDTHNAGTDPTVDFVTQSCPNGAWTRIYAVIDLTLYPTASRGISLWISFSSIDAISESVNVAQAMCIPGEYSLTNMPEYRMGTANIQQELAACQRYYEKSYDVDTAPGTATASGQIYTGCRANSTTNIDPGPWVQFKVTKRRLPVDADFSFFDQTGATGLAWNNGAQIANPTAVDSEGTNSFGTHFSGSSGLTATNTYIVRGHWTVDVEL